MDGSAGGDAEALAANLHALGADVDHLPKIPEELGDYIAGLTSADLERIRGDVRELEKLGLVEEQ